jgi:oxygen-dependent protoporphyrinogen oxidase
VSPRHVVIAGGGVTGLTVAYRLLEAQGPDRPKVTLLEALPRLGGVIRTERENGFVIDGGPDSFVATKPEATELCKDLGLGGRLIETTERNRRVYIRRGGELHLFPEGMLLAVPTRALPLARTKLLSWRGKARMALDLVIPRRARSADESIGAFIRRRLGSEALSVIAEPLLGGIYAGDIDALSIRSTFPQLLELEQKHGSLIRGALSRRRGVPATPGRAPPSGFYSLLGGMGELVQALASRIDNAGGDIRIGTSIRGIARPRGGPLAPPSPRFLVRVRGPSGEETLAADDMVFAIPAYAAAAVLEGFDSELVTLLRQTPYQSTGTVVLGYARADIPHPLDALGLLLPKSEGRRVLAATFISSKWVGRAPADMALLRVFVGGHRDEGALAESDESLIALGRRELSELLGVRAAPILSRVYRYDRSNAQPTLGHAERVCLLRDRAARHPGLHFAGAAFDGVGIPDCVRQANEIAARVRGA